MKHHHFLSGFSVWISFFFLVSLFLCIQCAKKDEIVDEPDPGYLFEGKIVFTNSSAIFVLEDGVTTLINVVGNTSGLTAPHHPRWSPDGKFIAYYHAFGGGLGMTSDSKISIDNADGSTYTTIGFEGGLSPLGGCFFPAWSPNGDQIAFCYVNAGIFGNYDFRIETIHLDGSNEQVIASIEGQPYGFDWSPDGSKFAVLSSLNGADNLKVLGLDGSIHSQSEPPYPVNLVDRNTIQIRWSPDNQKILLSYYWSDTDRMRAHIMMVDASLAESELIEDRGAFATWSPDGSQIAYLQPSEANHGGSYEGDLIILDLGSREKNRIASNYESYYMSGRNLDWH